MSKFRKRFFLMKKFLRKNRFHDIICRKFIDSKETEGTLNRLYDKHSTLKKENEQLRKELGSFEQVNFTDLYDGSRTILYMKKENIGDVE